MRIAMVGQKHTGSREGGIEVVVGELARRMAARGHEVTCYDRMGTGYPTESYERDGYRIVPVRTFEKKGLAALSSSFCVTKAALRSRPDVIHYHAEGPCVPLRLAHRAGVRTVATIHGLDWQRAKWGGIASAYIKFGERTAVKYADEFVVLSRGNRDYFKREYGREAKLVPNGITLEPDLPAREITEKWGLSSGSYLLFLGRIVPEKGLHYLMKAYQGLETDKPLIVAGDASDTSEYMAQIRNAAQSDSRVVLVGHVEGELLVELLSNAYCYVLPSDIEGMPMSLLEAMSHGRACVTSGIPECADVIANAGVTFPVGNASALRETLAVLLADSLRVTSLGQMARSNVLANYDWETVVDRTLSLYGKS